MYTTSFHIPLKVPKTKKRTILVGPAHRNQRNFLPRLSIKKLNEDYAKYCFKKDIGKKYDFNFVRNVYSNYTFKDLQKYPAVIIFPYSAYSMSMIEFYELNIPFFVPSINFAIQHSLLRDRCLYPTYCKKKEYIQMEEDYGDDNSPNSYSEKAQKLWLKYAYCYRQENVIIFDNFEDLFEKISHLEKDSEKNKAENV